MKVNRNAALAIGAAVLSLGVFGAASYAFVESSVPPSAQATAVSDTAVTSDTPTASPAPTTEPAKPDTMKQALKGLTDTAAQYLGVTTMDLMTQLKSGKSLADVANATPGKSRDGLVAALTTAASAKIDTAVTDGTLTADQAKMAKQKLSTEIAKLVDRAGHK